MPTFLRAESSCSSHAHLEDDEVWGALASYQGQQIGTAVQT